MPASEEARSGRGDLSSFLVHFTRDLTDGPAQQNLTSILSSGRIEARNAFGFARTVARNNPAIAVSQSVVCFSETPLSELPNLVKPIAGRKNALSSYGVAFLRDAVRAKGGNPVWYYGIGSPLETSLQNLFMQAFSSRADALAHPGMSVFPYLEGVGQLPNGRTKEFSWEREWRHVGDFEFDVNEVALVIAPEASHRAFSATFGSVCVDATWGLDRMFAALLGRHSLRTVAVTG